MSVFLTGVTGYIGAHVAAELLEKHGRRLAVLVRAADEEQARQRLWQAMQLHMAFGRFSDHLGERIDIFLGDLTRPRFGLDADRHRALLRQSESVLHCAASLNRKSEKSCLNVNLRGTLEVIKLAMAADADHGLRRFSQVSTVAVAGVLLPDVPRTVFRPSIVLGDSRRAETTQFDMVQAFVFLASRRILPFKPGHHLDIVPVDYVAESIAAIHEKEEPAHGIYHLSSGEGSETFVQISRALAQARNRRPPTFVPALERPFGHLVETLSRRRGWRIGQMATLLKVFLPYLVWNTVFDNNRVVQETDRTPAPFSTYCYPLLKFSIENSFAYPYKPWPAQEAVIA